MAAAAFASSRATKGLLLSIFTLLSLVCFTSSKMDKNKLEGLTRDLQKLLQSTERRQEEYKQDAAVTSELLGDVPPLMDIVIKQLNSVFTDFPALGEFLEDTKIFVEAMRPYIIKENEKKNTEMEGYKQNLKSLQRLLTTLKSHDEL